ncbi:hypothetical protein BN1708_016194 [Verticillium longisporum]|uniref:Uncharacterized protein n=1 Tax=Verticillium longisporum TaxID=100787 RepID=A0A0G4MF84_VERLO|nr:hypothetical protein BN1708_016194 [Verticillium longisporum]
MGTKSHTPNSAPPQLRAPILPTFNTRKSAPQQHIQNKELY